MSGQPPDRLHRALGVRGATIVGLSAMLGTGVFAVWTPALGLAGELLLASLGLAAVVAGLNAVSTARLAMRHPESGGAYAYGRRRLNRGAGVAAGIAFIIGKSASASAAALTIGAYLWPGHERPVAWLAVLVALAIDLRGIVTSTRVSALVVAAVLAVLAIVVVTGVVGAPPAWSAGIGPGSGAPLEVTAAAGLLFVAFAGYARVTVLGEEVRAPARTIPRAMVLSFAVVLLVYGAVGAVVLMLAGRGVDFGPAPLGDIAALSGWVAVDWMVRAGAVLGAGGVLVSLLAGIGRTLFAMADRGDAPSGLAVVGSRIRVPYRAEIAAAALAMALVAVGRIGWSLALSAGTILVYYSVVHLAALTLPGRGRYAVPVLGLVGCSAVLVGLVVQAAMGGLPAG